MIDERPEADAAATRAHQRQAHEQAREHLVRRATGDVRAPGWPGIRLRDEGGRRGAAFTHGHNARWLQGLLGGGRRSVDRLLSHGRFILPGTSGGAAKLVISGVVAMSASNRS